jgi:hypothetical protein
MRRKLALGLVPLGVLVGLKVLPWSGGDSLAAVAPTVAVPPGNGPSLRVTGAAVVVRASPSPEGAILGELQTGARIVRSEQHVGKQGCAAGWYAIRPAGVICAGDGVTLDDRQAIDPLVTLAPNREAALPYRYMKTTVRTPIFTVGGGPAQRVGEAPVGTWLAVTGQSLAVDPTGKLAKIVLTPQNLALSAYDVEPIRETAMRGATIEDPKAMPVGFVVRDGVTPFRLAESKGPVPLAPVPRYTRLGLSGKSHRRGAERFLGLDDGDYVRARDVTLIQRREAFPDFVADGVRWVDVSVATGTLVAYEGKKPVFATVVSVGNDRARGTRPTPPGTFLVTAKHITLPEAPPGTFDESRDIRDTPWVLDLSNGRRIHGAVWHDRFGLEFGPGNIQLAPADAAFLFRWVGGTIPEGWRAVEIPERERAVRVVVR